MRKIARDALTNSQSAQGNTQNISFTNLPTKEAYRVIYLLNLYQIGKSYSTIC